MYWITFNSRTSDSHGTGHEDGDGGKVVPYDTLVETEAEHGYSGVNVFSVSDFREDFRLSGGPKQCHTTKNTTGCTAHQRRRNFNGVI